MSHSSVDTLASGIVPGIEEAIITCLLNESAETPIDQGVCQGYLL